MKKRPPGKPQQSLFKLLKPYKKQLYFLLALVVLSNGLNLALPKIIAGGIDSYTHGNLVFSTLIIQFLVFAVIVFIFTYGQSVVQTYLSEKVARDLRERVAAKISKQSYLFVQNVTPAKLLTNLTADIDSIKMFIAQAIVQLISSIIIIVGTSVLLLSIDWQLALVVLLIIPLIGGTFFVIFSKVRALFMKSRTVLDRLNKVINESILGSALIRVLNSQKSEYKKFVAANSDAKDLGMQILQLFATLIPFVTFVANLATLVILMMGGYFVIQGDMTLGDFTAFNSYLALLIFPILILGFISNLIAQAGASYQRLLEVLDAPEKPDTSTLRHRLHGQVEVKNLHLTYGEKPVLKNVSFAVKPGTKTAIIGPTAAGKTQLLYLLTGLIEPNSGTIEYDGHNIHDYQPTELHKQIGFVFQDSIIFNMSVEENIAFSGDSTSDHAMKNAIQTSELNDFVTNLPKGLKTVVSERGTSLSGGQKQRIMLARALALNPKILLLDDFTARVDNNTEKKILDNVGKNYPDLTLISVTQKIASVEHYDQIILLMEGEILALGKHEHLMETCPEYVQIYESQKSTHQYESST